MRNMTNKNGYGFSKKIVVVLLAIISMCSASYIIDYTLNANTKSDVQVGDVVTFAGEEWYVLDARDKGNIKLFSKTWFQSSVPVGIDGGNIPKIEEGFKELLNEKLAANNSADTYHSLVSGPRLPSKADLTDNNGVYNLSSTILKGANPTGPNQNDPIYWPTSTDASGDVTLGYVNTGMGVYGTVSGFEGYGCRIRYIVYVQSVSLETEVVPGGNKSFFEKGYNANEDSVIANIKIDGSSYPFTAGSTTESLNIEVVPASNGADHRDKFKISDNNTNVLAKKNLDVGVYEFRLLISDSDNKPTPGMDAEGKPSNEYGYGVLSDDMKVIVYPTANQITYTQLKNDKGTANDTSDDEYYGKNEIDEQDLNLAKIEFSSDANIQALLNDGYAIKDVSIVNYGSSTPVTELKAVQSLDNVNLYNIKKKGNTISIGDKYFDIIVDFYNTNDLTETVTASIKLENKKYVVPTIYRSENRSFLGRE